MKRTKKEKHMEERKSRPKKCVNRTADMHSARVTARWEKERRSEKGGKMDTICRRNIP